MDDRSEEGHVEAPLPAKMGSSFVSEEAGQGKRRKGIGGGATRAAQGEEEGQETGPGGRGDGAKGTEGAVEAATTAPAAPAESDSAAPAAPAAPSEKEAAAPGVTVTASHSQFGWKPVWVASATAKSCT